MNELNVPTAFLSSEFMPRMCVVTGLRDGAPEASEAADRLLPERLTQKAIVPRHRLTARAPAPVLLWFSPAGYDRWRTGGLVSWLVCGAWLVLVGILYVTLDAAHQPDRWQAPATLAVLGVAGLFVWQMLHPGRCPRVYLSPDPSALQVVFPPVCHSVYRSWAEGLSEFHAAAAAGRAQP
ncbi:MAG: hypothetical protein ACREJ2_06480, partial [Planctomycetota bacterium]